MQCSLKIHSLRYSFLLGFDTTDTSSLQILECGLNDYGLNSVLEQIPMTYWNC